MISTIWRVDMTSFPGMTKVSPTADGCVAAASNPRIRSSYVHDLAAVLPVANHHENAFVNCAKQFQ